MKKQKSLTNDYEVRYLPFTNLMIQEEKACKSSLLEIPVI